MHCLPFRTVTSTETTITHLVVLSPQLHNCGPDKLPAETLCGRAVAAFDAGPFPDVECLSCLHETPAFMMLTAFEGSS